ncbi:hypothetical protein K2X83_03080 [Patescibacteria group bacterium]|nr:hypothetical protein [Patescibacteria group bacterium]
MKGFLIFLAGAVVAGLLVWWVLSMQPAQPAPITGTNTEQTNTTTGTSGTSGSTVKPGQPVAQGDYLLYTVNYNAGDFTPGVLYIERGDSIKFVNKDNLTMRLSVYSATSASASANVTDTHSLGKGGTYSLSFATPGVWVIQNINETGTVGSVGVVNVR